jgi:hypothetical protein
VIRGFAPTLAIGGLPLLSLKGSNNSAQGNALGNRVNNRPSPERAQQTEVPAFVMPFQGDQNLGTFQTQGVALGCIVPAFQAEKQTASFARLFYKSPLPG